jgi:hypothetical protein
MKYLKRYISTPEAWIMIILGIVFTALKLLKIIDWPWYIVLAPFYAVPTFIFSAVVMYIIILLMIDKPNKKRG